MEQPSAPGAAVAESPTAPDFSTYEREANTRDLARPTPSTPAPDAPADSSPAAPAVPGAATAADRDAGSAPATPPDKTPRNLQTRTQQLDAEVQQLQERLKLRRALRDELDSLDRRPVAPTADSPPATPTKAEWQRYRQHPDAPQAEDFESYEDFVAAQSVFIADKRYEERDQRSQLDAQSRERVAATQQTITGFSTKLATARETDPDFDTKVHPDLMSKIVPAFALAPGEPIRAANVILQEIVTSDVAPALLVHFSTPEGQAEWGALTKAPTPAAMLKQFGRIEARFVSDGAAAGSTPPAKPVTLAPAPPTTLGTRPPASPDRAGAAVKAGDYSAYEKAADAADLAVRRR